jgi:hypothetical protein
MNVAILISGKTERFDLTLDVNKNNLIQPFKDAGHNVDMHVNLKY